jgi:hypothetical protein
MRVIRELGMTTRCLLRITPQISDAPMQPTQNTFMVGARSLHLLVIRQPDYAADTVSLTPKLCRTFSTVS